MTFTEALRYHAQRYPNMKPVDAIKLVYQSEFGSGQNVSDPEETLLKIKSELQMAE